MTQMVNGTDNGEHLFSRNRYVVKLRMNSRRIVHLGAPEGEVASPLAQFTVEMKISN